MRRHRRSGTATDSMDMMLDTITNAFGGIVLLALLVTLMIGQQRPDPSPTAKTGEARVRAERARTAEALASERESLKLAMASQKLQLDAFGDSETERLMQQLLVAQQLTEELAGRIADSRQKLEATRLESASLEKSLERSRSELRTAEEQLAALDAKLDRVREQRTRTMETPREAVTGKPMTVALVRHGELFLVDANAGAGRFRVNEGPLARADGDTADIRLMQPHGSWAVVPGRGVPLENSDALRQELGRIQAGDNHLVLCVWPDSFGNFSNLRDACVAHSLEHRILPIDEGPVVESYGASSPTAQ